MERELAQQIEELVENGELTEVLMTLMMEHRDAFESLKEVIDDRIYTCLVAGRGGSRL